MGWWEGFENHRGESSAGQTELEPKYGSYGYAPADSRESLSLPGSGVREERGREGGVRRRFGEGPPLGREPRRLMHPSLGPPIDRPRHGPSSEIHNGQGRPRAAPKSCHGNSTSTSHPSPICVSVLCFLHTTRIALGLQWVRPQGIQAGKKLAQRSPQLQPDPQRLPSAAQVASRALFSTLPATGSSYHRVRSTRHR